MSISIEVVDMYSDEESKISSVYDQIQTIEKIEETKNIKSLYDDILDLKDLNFGRKLFNYIPQTTIVAFSYENNISKVVGYCGLDFNNGLHIESLCVDNKYRFKGIGKSILEKAYNIGVKLNSINPNWGDYIEYNAVEKPIDDLKYLILEVDRYENYKSLLAFYEKCGFKGVEKRGYSEVTFKKLIK